MSKEAAKKSWNKTGGKAWKIARKTHSFLYVQSVLEVVYSIGIERMCILIFMALYVIHAFNMENSRIFSCPYKFLYGLFNFFFFFDK